LTLMLDALVSGAPGLILNNVFLREIGKIGVAEWFDIDVGTHLEVASGKSSTTNIKKLRKT